MREPGAVRARLRGATLAPHGGGRDPRGLPSGGSRPRSPWRRPGDQRRTYSNSTGIELMPLAGGAIQAANFPGSRTAFISDFT